jgi:hypothetical protein
MENSTSRIKRQQLLEKAKIRKGKIALAPSVGDSNRAPAAPAPARAVLGYDTTGDGQPDAFDTNQDGRIDVRGGAGVAARSQPGWDDGGERHDKGIALADELQHRVAGLETRLEEKTTEATRWRHALQAQREEGRRSTEQLDGVTLAVDVKVILAPPCILHERFFMQNIQGGMKMTLTSTSR